MPGHKIDIVRLAPHDPIPTGPTRQVVVLHRLDEDAPRQTVTTIILTGQHDESTRPMRPDGLPMSLAEAIAAAKKVAASEDLDRVLLIDRAQGQREREILQHGGDHSIHGEGLVDIDLEDGEHGSDMRDRAP